MTIPDSFDLATYLNNLSSEALSLLGGLEISAGLLTIAALPVLGAELWRLWRAGGLDRGRLAGMGTSLFCAVPATVVEILLGAALIGLYLAVSAASPWSIPMTLPAALACLLLVDLAYYWEHRLAHRVNVLWSLYHSVHHSANHMDVSIAFRVSFVDFFISPLVYLPLVFLGFDPLLVLSCLLLVLAWQTWIHTELVGRLPWLDGWLNTPSNHRVHHGRNAAYIDKNYGGLLIIWDRLFGTYARETESVDYGLVRPLESTNPWAVHTHGVVTMAGQIQRASGAKAVACVLLNAPKDHPRAPRRGLRGRTTTSG